MVCRTQDIILERKDGIARLTLSRPEALNAFRESMRLEIGATIRQVGDDVECKVLVFTGAGWAFAAGGDVKAMAERAKTTENVLARRHYMRSVVGGARLELYNLEKPTIAMLNFHALREYEALATTIGTQTEDHKEGVRAFVEKRAPQFRGR